MNASGIPRPGTARSVNVSKKLPVEVSQGSAAGVAQALTASGLPPPNFWLGGTAPPMGPWVMPAPATKMYASPQAVVFVSGSVPHTGWVEVSVATARGAQSERYEGKVMWSEQDQPCRSELCRSANDGFDAISSTLPPHGTAESSDQLPVPVLSCSSTGTARPPEAQLVSKQTPVRSERAPAKAIPSRISVMAPGWPGS